MEQEISKIRSMTGYGRGECIVDNVRYVVEMRSVNHRFAEIVVRLPAGWNILEDPVRKQVQQVVRRGRVDVWITVDSEGALQRSASVDWQLATSIVGAAEEIKKRLNLPGSFGVGALLAFPDVLLLQESQVDPERHAAPLLSAVGDATSELLRMRIREGKVLRGDLEGRIQGLQQKIDSLSQRAPLVVEEYRARLASRLREFLDGREFDEDRVLLEAALFAEKADIQEELTRLASHVEQFSGALHSEEPVGRRLDFLLQEMNREINTIGSKASDQFISSQVVECKSELEKMREQVQNIE